MKKPVLPDPHSLSVEMASLASPVKEHLDILAGRTREGKIVRMDEATATAADCAGKINEILDLLQGEA
ncbi:MAG: hypothetical protein ING91_19520 [Rhodocyclaceae bacterium]|nr:hypothetical protein [Rhodocyclaceae bacterium]MCA3848769.1 hypothetical protein [Burkholderia sp.]